ncbi:MAG: tRNA pseudouridine(38-40) synthase TruA [Gemmatales bacterium]
MRNIKLTISYDGTDFFGWQRQNEFRSVQQELEEVIQKLNGGVEVACIGCSRTDSGVHALGQVASFRSNITLPPDRFLYALNGNLPEDVVVRSVEDVPDDFNANRLAKRKMYRYIIHDNKVPDVFQRKYSWHFPYARLDEVIMNQAAECLLGKHDFRCFETEWPNRKTSVRTITHLKITRVGEFLWLDIEADGFLYNMVRSITGTLVNIGRGYWPVEQMKQILEKGERAEAGPTSPAQGLFLMRITY